MEPTNIAHEETERLIASDKVEGTAVYDRNGDRLGTVHNFMVEKRTGRVEYAVLSAGGGLLRGTRYYPLPWDVLTYDTGRGGYVVDFVPGDLENAPSYERDEDARYDRDFDTRIRSHYPRR